MMIPVGKARMIQIKWYGKSHMIWKFFLMSKPWGFELHLGKLTIWM